MIMTPNYILSDGNMSSEGEGFRLFLRNSRVSVRRSRRLAFNEWFPSIFRRAAHPIRAMEKQPMAFGLGNNPAGRALAIRTTLTNIACLMP
jgi:hypothetical protein